MTLKDWSLRRTVLTESEHIQKIKPEFNILLGSIVEFLSYLTDDRRLKIPPDTAKAALYPPVSGRFGIR